MRTLAVLAAALLAACGGSSRSSSSSASNDVTVTGSLGGHFTNGSGLVSSGTCSVQGIGVGGGVAVVGLSSSGADLCRALQQGRSIAGATFVNVIAFKLKPGGQAQAVTPGSYPVVDVAGGSLPAADTSGNVSFAVVSVSRNAASAGAGQGCAVTDQVSATSGTVTITSTSGDVAGTVIATLSGNAGTVNGTFGAPTCAGFASLDASTCQPGGIPSETSCQ